MIIRIGQQVVPAARRSLDPRGPARRRDRTAEPAASITMLPGPVSNAITSSGFAFAGITVMFAMPPMFSAMRARLGMPEELIVEKRNQRRAFAAGRHVAGTKIGDGLDARALGDHRRLADLHRARDLAAEKFDRLAFVKNRLAVRSDQLDGFERHAGLFAAPRRTARRAENSAARSWPCASRRSKPKESPRALPADTARWQWPPRGCCRRYRPRRHRCHPPTSR